MQYKTIGNMNVYQAAEKRVLKVFAENYHVDLMFSGGKDSIAVFLVVFNTMRKFGISFKRLSVTFVDEEAIYPDIPYLKSGCQRKAYGGGVRTHLSLALISQHVQESSSLSVLVQL